MEQFGALYNIDKANVATPNTAETLRLFKDSGDNLWKMKKKDGLFQSFDYLIQDGVVKGQTADDVLTEIFVLNQSGQRVSIPTNKSMFLPMFFLARKTDDGQTGFFVDNYLIKNVGDVLTVFFGNLGPNAFSGDPAAADWTVELVPSGKFLKFLVKTNVPGQIIDWAISPLRTAQV